MFLPTVATTTPICEETPKSVDDIVESQTVNGNPVETPNEFTSDFTTDQVGDVEFISEFKEPTSVTRIDITSPSEDPEDTWRLTVDDEDGNPNTKEGVSYHTRILLQHEPFTIIDYEQCLSK